MAYTGSGARIGKGATLKDASGNAIAEITDLGEFGETASDIDVTNLDTSNNWIEYIAGMREGGEFPVTCNFLRTDTSGQLYRITDCQNGTRVVYTIALPGGTTWSALMYPKSYRIRAPVKDAIRITFVFKICSQPTFTA
jgi:hypothetical protein